MRIALAQMNPRIGDFTNNVNRAADFLTRAAADRADLVVFPEFTLIGYPPKDLLLRPDFIAASLRALDDLAKLTKHIHAIVGYAEPNPGPSGKPLCNALAVLASGSIQSRHYKQLLPTYDVFDEYRYFEPRLPENASNIATIAGRPVGITICEDLWCDPNEFPLYHTDPVQNLVGKPIDFVVNISASPYAIGKPQSRPKLYARQARRLARPLIVVNQVGAHDDLIFDGNSCAFDSAGNLLAHCKEFEEDLLIFDLTHPGRIETPAADMPCLYRALLFGIREYVIKSNHSSVLVGLSGGIDSALVATLAVQALGPSNVLGVAMPGRHSSTHSLEDAIDLAHRLGIFLRTIPITILHDAYSQTLPEELTGLADENIQARIRGNLLMALSNRHHHLVLSTANKSELALGYGTLYGDMIGALAPLADLTKTRVRQLANWINAHFNSPIPERTLTKPPSAELSPDQTDEAHLGPYAQLDQLIIQSIEHNLPPNQLSIPGLDRPAIDRLLARIDSAEFKRRQAPLGLKVTPRAFGTGRPMPIVR
ncbi:MAG TPA: NAD+ synthase [Tepidisphaeraceae bacterium]|jgi:NAD+ synthetase|nr:NAD+ synthase [Tepidisphaeraceae bacterium]